MTPPASPLQRLRIFSRIHDFGSSLAGRLLALTIVSVVVAEALVFAPALAVFHEQWLRERMNLAQVAALALEAQPGEELADSLENELLVNAEVQRAALQREGERVLLLEGNGAPTKPLVTYDYTQANAVQRFFFAWQTFLAPDGRVLRALARPRFETGEFIEIVLNEGPLKRAMNEFARQFIWASMWILIGAG